ncbi:MAG: hypothetical protein MJ178_02790 [Treponemataceae bacterium]|nr:hypothetical protein [Treponemataceae bacterium]
MQPTLLVLAAGMGSRYGGIKQIDAVGLHNECLLDYATYDAMTSGYGKVVYVIRKDIENDFRERFFDRVARNFNAEYVFQEPTALFTPEQIALQNPERTKPWGTMHAVLCGEKAVQTPFTVINADDYYGRDAFRTMGAHLSSLTPESTDHAIVGYVLENTMSRIGSVSRGVMETAGDDLVSITENTKIYYDNTTGTERILSDMNDGTRQLTGKEWVSMNFMGFNTNAFKTFHEYWEEFLKDNVSSLKGEAYLPSGASRIIQTGVGKMKFFTSTEKWFGMTYQEDRQLVRDAIAEKIKSGYYPEKLWNN